MTTKPPTEPKENGEFYPFSHYYIFGYVMENYNDVARKLISIVLNKKVRKVYATKPSMVLSQILNVKVFA